MTAAPPADDRRTAPDTPDAGAAVDDRTLGRWLWDRLRSSWPVLAVVVAIVVAAALTATRPREDVPLGPDSTGDDGTAALLDALAAVDRSARVVDPDALGAADAVGDGTVVLLLRDQLEGPQADGARDRLRDVVRRGGRLVVADPTSPLTPNVTGATALLDRTRERACDVAALRDVDAVRPGAGALYEAGEGAVGCFGDADGVWLVATPVGRGHIVALGGPGVFTNAGLRDADNAVLAVQLLTPAGAAGPTVVRPLPPTVVSQREQTLGDLVPRGVRTMVLQLLVAFGVYVMWRARRLGRPLVDDAPVRLASADLTTAVGALSARNATRGAAVGRIVDDARGRIARRLGLPRTADVADVAVYVAARTGRDVADVTAVLTPPDPTDDAMVLDAAAALAALERDVHATLVTHTGAHR